jgi:DNA invertase Pin-like site-specific DNA recombinase
MNEKIKLEHLTRAAYVYVRQSSGHQVRHHRESLLRQYALAERATQLGFEKVVVIDDDLGVTGAGTHERRGFGRLLTAVCQKAAGAVVALEASRLARNNRDWYHLIDLCAMTETLLIDDDGIYDPRLINDRLVLGVKGTMSEFELSLLRQRAREAFEQKVRRGCVLWQVPIGFVRTDEDQIEKVPNRQVQQAVQLVFQKFRELGSARQTMLWFRDAQIRVPAIVPSTGGEEIVWQLPNESRIHQMLRNPIYAGALAYGRTKAHCTLIDGRLQQTSRSRKARADWSVLLQEHHDGYISWEEYCKNQQILEANLAKREVKNTGAAKSGPALLSGLLRCGRCGRMLFVAYGGNGGRVPRYGCKGGRVNRGSAACLSVGSLRIDQAVVEQVLAAIQPAGLHAALAAEAEVGREQEQIRRTLTLAVERARYEAHRAQRQFDAVDPDNRLVASELEARWNQALAKVAEVEARLHALAPPQPLSPSQKEQLVLLGSDLSLVWQHPAAPVELKKRILRTVLEEIVIDRVEEPAQELLHLHWKGGVHTELRVARNGTGHHRRVADDKAIELIEELSKICTAQLIAQVLNRLGYRTGQGQTWRVHHIYNVRYERRLPSYPKKGAWLTLQETAAELRVSGTVIKRLLKEGILPARQVVPGAPWVIERKNLQLPMVQAQIQAVHAGRKLSHTAVEQAELPLQYSIL